MSTVSGVRAHSTSQCKRGRLSYLLLLILCGVGLVLFAIESELFEDDYYVNEEWTPKTYSKEEIAMQVLDMLDPEIKKSIVNKNATGKGSSDLEVASEALKKVELLVKGLENKTLKEKLELNKELTRLDAANTDVAKYVMDIKASQDKNVAKYNSLLKELERSQHLVAQLQSELKALKNKELGDRKSEEVMAKTTEEDKAQKAATSDLKNEELRRIISSLFDYIINYFNLIQEKQIKDVASTMSSIDQVFEKLTPLVEAYSKTTPIRNESVSKWTRNMFEGFSIEFQNFKNQYAAGNQSVDKKAEKGLKKVVKKILNDARSLKESFLIL